MSNRNKRKSKNSSDVIADGDDQWLISQMKSIANVIIDWDDNKMDPIYNCEVKTNKYEHIPDSYLKKKNYGNKKWCTMLFHHVNGFGARCLDMNAENIHPLQRDIVQCEDADWYRYLNIELLVSINGGSQEFPVNIRKFRMFGTNGPTPEDFVALINESVEKESNGFYPGFPLKKKVFHCSNKFYLTICENAL